MRAIYLVLESAIKSMGDEMVERQQKQLVWVEPSMLLNPTQLVVGHDKTFTFGLTYFVGLEQQK